MIDLIKFLKEKGYKVTPQRIAVYDILKNTKEHPSVDMLYSKLQPVYPTMSLATVYKSLEVFKELGLVQELNVGEDKFRYDANVNQHPHITCINCGKVEDVYDEMLFDLADQVQKKTGYQLTNQQLYFFG
ncbi:MAG TPA: transcriptional repressor, partial [Candidatus Diapherotrites archaeon]|nr:transcriptional repressor [Candidatus Diapherotrites archaeon]